MTVHARHTPGIAFLTVIVLNSWAQAGAPGGLVNFWPFEDSLADVSARSSAGSGAESNDLVAPEGSPSFVDGRVGRGIRLGPGAAAPWVETGVGRPPGSGCETGPSPNPDLDLGGVFSVEFWLRPEDLSTLAAGISQTIIRRPAITSAAYTFEIIRRSAFPEPDINFGFAVGIGDCIGSRFPLVEGGEPEVETWFHVAGVASEAGLELYVNGTLVDSRDYDPDTVSIRTPEQLLLGSRLDHDDPRRFFHGVLDEVAFWKRALTPEEIRDHFEAGPAGYGLSTTIEDVPIVEALDDSNGIVLAPDETAPLRVRVTNRSGSPLAGVRILFQASGVPAGGTFDGAPGDGRSFLATTDADGIAAAPFRAGAAGLALVEAVAADTGVPGTLGSATFAVTTTTATPTPTHGAIEARRVIDEELLGDHPQDESLIAHGPFFLPAGTEVRAAGVSSLRYPTEPRTLTRDEWFAWVDLNAVTAFAHPTRFVGLDASVPADQAASTAFTTEEGWWPVVTLPGTILEHELIPGARRPPLLEPGKNANEARTGNPGNAKIGDAPDPANSCAIILLDPLTFSPESARALYEAIGVDRIFVIESAMQLEDFLANELEQDPPCEKIFLDVRTFSDGEHFYLLTEDRSSRAPIEWADLFDPFRSFTEDGVPVFISLFVPHAGDAIQAIDASGIKAEVLGSSDAESPSRRSLTADGGQIIHSDLFARMHQMYVDFGFSTGIKDPCEALDRAVESFVEEESDETADPEPETTEDAPLTGTGAPLSSVPQLHITRLPRNIYAPNFVLDVGERQSQEFQVSDRVSELDVPFAYFRVMDPDVAGFVASSGAVRPALRVELGAAGESFPLVIDGLAPGRTTYEVLISEDLETVDVSGKGIIRVGPLPASREPMQFLAPDDEGEIFWESDPGLRPMSLSTERWDIEVSSGEASVDVEGSTEQSPFSDSFGTSVRALAVGQANVDASHPALGDAIPARIFVTGDLCLPERFKIALLDVEHTGGEDTLPVSWMVAETYPLDADGSAALYVFDPTSVFAAVGEGSPTGEGCAMSYDLGGSLSSEFDTWDSGSANTADGSEWKFSMQPAGGGPASTYRGIATPQDHTRPELAHELVPGGASHEMWGCGGGPAPLGSGTLFDPRTRWYSADVDPADGMHEIIVSIENAFCPAGPRDDFEIRFFEGSADDLELVDYARVFRDCEEGAFGLDLETPPRQGSVWFAVTPLFEGCAPMTVQLEIIDISPDEDATRTVLSDDGEETFTASIFNTGTAGTLQVEPVPSPRDFQFRIPAGGQLFSSVFQATTTTRPASAQVSLSVPSSRTIPPGHSITLMRQSGPGAPVSPLASTSTQDAQQITFTAPTFRFSRFALVALPSTPPEQPFRRGDPNADGILDITDAISILQFLFLGDEAPTCQKAADSNDDGMVDITDAVFLLGFQFLGTDAPPEPTDCGDDPTDDPLDCLQFAPCE